MRPHLLLIALVPACTLDDPGGEGIAIGNPPGKAQLRVTVADGLDVVMTDFGLPVSGIYLETCDGDGQTIDVERETVLTLDDGVLELDTGTVCALGIIPTDGPTILRGAAGDGTFLFESALGRIMVYGEVSLNEDEPFVLELGEPDWLTSADFGLVTDQHLNLGVDCLNDALCERIRAGLMDRGGLFDDPNGDGDVDSDERDDGSSAEGDDRRDGDASDRP